MINRVGERIIISLKLELIFDQFQTILDQSSFVIIPTNRVTWLLENYSCNTGNVILPITEPWDQIISDAVEVRNYVLIITPNELSNHL